MGVDCHSYREHRFPGWGTVCWHIGGIGDEDGCYEGDMVVAVVHDSLREWVYPTGMQRTDSLLFETRTKAVRVQRRKEGMNERLHCCC